MSECQQQIDSRMPSFLKCFGSALLLKQRPRSVLLQDQRLLPLHSWHVHTRSEHVLAVSGGRCPCSPNDSVFYRKSSIFTVPRLAASHSSGFNAYIMASTNSAVRQTCKHVCPRDQLGRVSPRAKPLALAFLEGNHLARFMQKFPWLSNQQHSSMILSGSPSPHFLIINHSSKTLGARTRGLCRPLVGASSTKDHHTEGQLSPRRSANIMIQFKSIF
jgi:hypothetical protein